MQNDILKAYSHSNKRLFLLDYDGTLAELELTPLEAAPTPRILDTLTKLGNHPQNTVVIVSGRKHEEMEAWLGNLPVSLVGEHGMLAKKPGEDWVATKVFDTSWKPEIMAIMQRYHDATPGSIIEDKTNNLVWHYAAAPDSQQAKAAETALAKELKPICDQQNLRLMFGHKVVEVMPFGFDKGISTTFWLKQDSWDFVLIAGDDTTDEDMFKVAPDSAFMIKVGPRETIAPLHINSPSDMLGLLETLADA